MLEIASVALSTTAAKLSTSTDQFSGKKHSVLVTASAVLYLGPANVTSATGYPLAAGTSLSVDLAFGDDLYGILAAGTGTANVLRSGV